MTKRRGRPPAALARAREAAAAPDWLYHHLTVSGPAAELAEFAETARGAGVIPWRLDLAAIEEDIFNLAASQPLHLRSLSIDGCRILARQFRERVDARQARAAALIGRSQACPFDLHTLLPVPVAILQLGPRDPAALAWLTAHWGTTDGLRQVVERPGRRRPGMPSSARGFTTGATPHAAVVAIGPCWPALRFLLQPHPAD